MFSSFFFNNMFVVLPIWMYNTQCIEGGRSIFFPWDLNRARSYRSLWEYLYGKKKNCSLVSFKCVSMIKEHKALVYNSNWLLILMRMRTTNKREAKKTTISLLLLYVVLLADITSWIAWFRTASHIQWARLWRYSGWALNI